MNDGILQNNGKPASGEGKRDVFLVKIRNFRNEDIIYLMHYLCTLLSLKIVMDLKTEILNAHSKANRINILKWIGKDAEKVDQLIELFLMEDMRLVQRSAWVITSIAETYPEGMEKHLPTLVNRMVDDRLPVGVRRNMIRSLQFMNIPTSLQGMVLQASFSFLENPKEGNVVQVFAMSVIEKLTKEYPELIPEFACLIEKNLESEPSPAFNNRARKTLNRLKRRVIPTF